MEFLGNVIYSLIGFSILLILSTMPILTLLAVLYVLYRVLWTAGGLLKASVDQKDKNEK